MIPIEVEIIFILSQFIYFSRLIVQSIETHKRKLSVNPKLFWILTIIASILMGIYGWLIGSWSMPIANGLAIIYSTYQYQYGV